MDWKALGTWAAVVVALSISLRDTWERKRDRTARHLLTTAWILPEVMRLRDALGATLDESNHLIDGGLQKEKVRYMELLIHMLNAIGLQHLRDSAAVPGALPERMLIQLVKALKLADMLLETYSRAEPRERARTDYEIESEFADCVCVALQLKRPLIG